jgi:hypothetical protein
MKYTAAQHRKAANALKQQATQTDDPKEQKNLLQQVQMFDSLASLADKNPKEAGDQVVSPAIKDMALREANVDRQEQQNF